MKRILVFSNFGYQTGVLGGQTIKVRHIYKLFESKKREYKFNLNFFDTDIFKNKLLVVPSVFSLLYKLFKCDILVFVGSKNNLKYIYPLLHFFCGLFKKEIHYIVVGGWLDDFLKANPKYISKLESIAGIYPQTEILCDRLIDSYNLNNVFQLNNFRVNDFNSFSSDKKSNSLIKLVFMARVSSEKGVDTLFKLAKEIEVNRLNCIIDIYGPIGSGYKDKFESLLSSSNDSIQYLGVADPSKVHDVLNGYNALVFPTIYLGEGFPGSVLDSYIAGIPVVVSNWQYANEFVVDGKTGLIANFGDEDDFIQKTISLIKDKDLLETLTSGAKGESVKYSPEAAWEVLEKHIFKRIT